MRRLLELPHASPSGQVLVAGSRGRLVGGAAVTGFGATGWIGALGVAGGARRRGVGTALTEAAAAWLHDHGAQTVLLYATAAGRRVYDRVGFVEEGCVHAWRDVLPPPRSGLPPGIRPVEAADRAAVRALDADATGEDRTEVLDALDHDAPGAGLVVMREGEVTGSALRSPWGLGPSIVAADTESGLALLSALRRDGGPPLTLSVPDANAAAARALRAWGLRAINEATRMRLGPAVAYRPERVFGLFNLFWG